MRPLLITFVLHFVFATFLGAQMPIGHWREHLPYFKGEQVIEVKNKIYCLAEGNLFYYNKADNTLEKLNKIKGLTDIDISSINYSTEIDIIIIGYNNGNVDLIENNNIYNIGDIKRKQIVGLKRINSIYPLSSVAYLSTGFGIVVLNLEKKEIKDTYYLGELGSKIEIFDVTSDDQYLYAATEKGLLMADVNAANLIDYSQWQNMESFPGNDETIRQVEVFNNNLYVLEVNKGWGNDSIYTYDGEIWETWDWLEETDYFSVRQSKGNIIVVSRYLAEVINAQNEKIRRFGMGSPRDAYLDDDDILWLADEKDGLVRNIHTWWRERLTIDGPEYAGVSDLEIMNDLGWVAGGGPSNPYDHKGIYKLENNSWYSFNRNTIQGLDSISNISEIVIDPANENHVFGGSFGYGLVEFLNGEVINYWDERNSILQNVETYGHGYVRVNGLDFDDNGNLYIATSLVKDPFFVLTNQGKLIQLEFNYSGFGNRQSVLDLIVTSNNQKWALLDKNGIFVFDDGGTPNEEKDDREKKITVTNEDGEVRNNVYSISEDLDGNIWVGTSEGPVVYYNPLNIFESNDIRAHQVKIPRNDGTGLADYLLGNDIITSIAVDGANRKWFGTEKSGVYLISEDGLNQLKHFDEENSYLLDNKITSIAIEHKSGEVFFGTEKGIISYRAEATKGGEDFGEVYVFPNPVREDYSGVITITGLLTDVNVKITDISGNIVYETQALGGQAIWDGTNFSGKRVQTGVYLVFCTNEDGSKTHVTKLLFIN